MENNNIMEECTLCPIKCKVNRLNGNKGKCNGGINPKIALANLHYYEEPCISGETGSGTIFFTGCNMNCIFCQNYKISQENLGEEISVSKLAAEFIRLQKEGANNINLVTGFMYVPQIIEVIKIARHDGLKIPIVYNSSGYESVETLKLLEGYIDVYLPDFKYYDDELAFKLSGVKDYSKYAKEAILEMYRQVGVPRFFDNGIIKSGLIIRHLVLPNYIENSKKVLKWIKENINKDVYVSIMAQYFPSYKAKERKDINRKLLQEELDQIEDLVYEYDFKGFIQDIEDNEEQYVPNFEKK